MKKLSREKIAEILRLRERGFAYWKITAETGLSLSAVYKYCSSYRPELKNVARHRKDQEVIDEITKLRRKGYSLRKIGREVNASGPLIQKVCKQYCPGLSKIGFRKIDQKVLDTIDRHYREGYSTKELSEMAGCHIATVQRYLKGKGVKLPLTTKRKTVDKNKIYRLYKEGLGTKEIAVRSGYCRDSVKRCLRGLGIKLPLKKIRCNFN